jgi:hypothetical protein
LVVVVVVVVVGGGDYRVRVPCLKLDTIKCASIDWDEDTFMSAMSPNSTSSDECGSSKYCERAEREEKQK